MDALSMEDPTMQKQKNYLRLCLLILELGTEVIRTVILSNLKNGETLDSLLDNNRIQLKKLLDKKILNKKQWSILYPSGAVVLMQIDITLWLFLMHNLILKNMYGRKFVGYSDIMEIKNVRNELLHVPKPELDDSFFNSLWNRATVAISNLDSHCDQAVFDRYRSMEIDKERMAVFQRCIAEQFLEERIFYLHESDRCKSLALKILSSVFISFVIAVVSAAVYFTLDSNPCSKYKNSYWTNKGVITIVKRQGWIASPPKDDYMTPLEKPASLIIYTHTADTQACHVSDVCCITVNHIQYAHMHRDHDPWADIAYHYLIDSNGIIYEGRSTDFIPAAAKCWNNHTISIAVIGNYMYESNIPGSMKGAFSILLDWLVQRKILSTDYTMYGWMAKLVAHLPDKQDATGSNPGRTVSYSILLLLKQTINLGLQVLTCAIDLSMEASSVHCSHS